MIWDAGCGRCCSGSMPRRAHRVTFALLDACAPLLATPQSPDAAPVQADGARRSPIQSVWPPAWTRTAQHIDALARWASASSRSAPSPRGRNPAIRVRACSACPQAHAVINRMGFNNLGVDRLVRNVRAAALPRHPRHQHRQELRHADRARGRRLPRLHAQGVSAGELPDGQHLLAEHQEPAPTAGGRRARPPARGAQGRAGASSRRSMAAMCPWRSRSRPT